MSKCFDDANQGKKTKSPIFSQTIRNEEKIERGKTNTAKIEKELKRRRAR